MSIDVFWKDAVRSDTSIALILLSHHSMGETSKGCTYKKARATFASLAVAPWWAGKAASLASAVEALGIPVYLVVWREFIGQGHDTVEMRHKRKRAMLRKADF